MALFSLTGRSGVRNSIPMLARMQRASEYLHKGMDQPPNGPYGKCRAVQGEAAEVPTCNPWGVSRLILQLSFSFPSWSAVAISHREGLIVAI